MTVLRLGSDNVLSYLVQKSICAADDVASKIDQLVGKNLNLLVHLSSAGSAGKITVRYVVKQGPVGRLGIPKDGFDEEWRFSRLLRFHEKLAALQTLVSEPISYDVENQIIVYRFLDRYQDLGDFYSEYQLYPPVIAAAVGVALASFHQATFNRNDYLLELDPDSPSLNPSQHHRPNYCHELSYLTPSIFQRVSVDGLRFYQLCQRAHDLFEAIFNLEADSRRCCLTHGDFKFNNVLLHHGWLSWRPQVLPASTSSLLLADEQSVVRLIDWEQWIWGDPALDAGAFVAEYLRAWLKSLKLSRDVDLAVALKLAAVPLEKVQPSIQAFLQAYTSQFSEILNVFPDFLNRLFRFAGLGLIRMIQDSLHYHEPFGTVEQSMLQVAKSLLCQPDAARMTILGCTSLNFSGFDPQNICTNSPIPKRACPRGRKPESQVLLPLWTRYYSPDLMLADLIENIRIEPLLIEHPAYQSLDLAQPARGDCDDQGFDQYHSLPEELQRAYHIAQLRNYIHDIYFSGEQEKRGSVAVHPQQLVNNTIAGLDISFLGLLQDANHGTGFMDPDWIIIGIKHDQVQIDKDGLRLWVDPAVDLVMHRMPAGSSVQDPPPLADLAVGISVCLRMPNALFAGEHYIAISNQGEPITDRPRISIYFNISAEGAPVLMDMLSEGLNDAAVRYMLRVLNDPLRYGGFNAAILEIEAEKYPVFLSMLEATLERIRPHLRDPVPLFSHRLGLGISLVESPEDDQDFGLSRCELLAQALLDSDSCSHSRREMIMARFLQHSLDWERPYLNPASTAQYALLDTARVQHDIQGCQSVVR